MLYVIWLSKTVPFEFYVTFENSNNKLTFGVFSHIRSTSTSTFSPLSIHIHLFSSVRQHQEPGQPHTSQPFYLNRIFQKSYGYGFYKLCCPSALSSKKVSVNEISALIDTNIFQKGDGIIFNVQETISQRITKFKQYRKYKMIDLKLWSCGQVIYFWPIYLSRKKTVFCYFSSLELLPTAPKINI